MSETIAAEKDSPADNSVNEKIWEKALTTNEIRKLAANWSLGGDAGLLKHMQEFATRLTTRAHEVHCEVSQLTHDTKLMDTKIQCVTDHFLILSDKQFIENRVYDEDVSIKNDEVENKDESIEKSKEEKEKELISKLKRAVGFGLNVMEECFDVLDIKAGDSDLSEDEDADDLNNEVILEAKDIYVNRPLPFLIGSRDFYEDDNVGIGDFPSSDEVESDAGSLSESEDEIEKANTVSDLSTTDYSSSDEEKQDDEKVKSKPHLSSSSDMSSDDYENNKVINSKNSSDSYSSDESVEVVKKKQVKKKKTRTRNSTQDNDMFFGDQQDRDNLFASSGGLFGSNNKLFDAPKKGGGLFDDLSDENGSDSNKSDNSDFSEEEKIVEKPQKKQPAKTMPHGGVNLFGGAIKKGFFNDDKSDSGSEEEFDAKEPPPQNKGLFDDDDSEEEGDLFGGGSQQRKTVKPTQSRTKLEKGGLFDDASSESDEESLFPTPSKPRSSKESIKIKQPVGGVSMFSSEGGKIQSDLKKRIQRQSSSSVQSEANTRSGNSDQSSKSTKVQSKKSSRLFSESSDDENFLFVGKDSSKNTFNTSLSNSSRNKIGKKHSLFGDSGSSSDNDLFGSTKSGSFSSKTDVQKRDKTGNKSTLSERSDADTLFSHSKPKEQAKNLEPSKTSNHKTSPHEKQKTNLFGDSSGSDDLFSSKPKKKKNENVKTSSYDKSNNLFNSLSEDDLFGDKINSKSKTSSDSPDLEKVTKVQSSPKVTKAKPSSKVTKSSGLFGNDSDSDSDGLFSTNKNKPAPKPKAKQPEKKKELLPEKAISTVKKGGLFDESSDDDNDFFFQKPEKPKKEEKLIQNDGKLFTSDSDAEKGKTESDEEVAEEKEEPVKRKTLPGAVSMFGAGGGELLAAISKRRSASQKSSSSTKSNASDILSEDVGDSKLNKNQPSELLDSEKLMPKQDLNKVKPEAPDLKEKKSEKQEINDTKSKTGLDKTKPDLNERSAKNNMAKPFTSVPKEAPSPGVTKVAAPKFNAKSIGKLQTKININPNAMLPGAVPTIKSSRDFDQPLDSATKSRSKGQGGRRPPTRRGRQKIVEQSNLGADFENSMSKPTISVVQQNSETKTKKAVDKKPQVAKEFGQLPDSVDSFLDDVISTKPTKKTNKQEKTKLEKKTVTSAEKHSETKTSKITDLFSDDDDLFSSVQIPKAKSKKSKAVDELFDNLLEDDENDLFSPPANKSNPVDDLDDMFSEKSTPLLEDTKSSSKGKKHNMFGDDLFGDLEEDILVTKGSRKSDKKDTKKMGEIDDFDDLFGDTSPQITSQKHKKKPLKVTDDLFGDDDDDDLFAEKSFKKTTKSANNLPKNKDLFLDSDDDIFSGKTLKPISEKAKPSNQKEAKEQDIFDDPLNALFS